MIEVGLMLDQEIVVGQQSFVVGACMAIASSSVGGMLVVTMGSSMDTFDAAFASTMQTSITTASSVVIEDSKFTVTGQFQAFEQLTE